MISVWIQCKCCYSVFTPLTQGLCTYCFLCLEASSWNTHLLLFLICWYSLKSHLPKRRLPCLSSLTAQLACCYGLNVWSSPNSYVEILMPKVMVWGSRTFKKLLGPEGGTLMNRISPLIIGALERSFTCFPPREKFMLIRKHFLKNSQRKNKIKIIRNES